MAMVGKIEQARKASAEALALDPLNTYTRFTQAYVDFLHGEFETASRRFRKIVDDLTPGEPFFLWWLAQAKAHQGQLDEAKGLFARVAASDAVTLADLSELFCCAAAGDLAAVTEMIEQKKTMVETAKADETFPNVIATCPAFAGDEDGALEWLNRAIDWGFCNYRYLEEYNRFLKPLHGNPRFQELVDKARWKHEEFDA